MSCNCIVAAPSRSRLNSNAWTVGSTTHAREINHARCYLFPSWLTFTSPPQLSRSAGLLAEVRHMSPFDVAPWTFLTRFSTNLNVPSSHPRTTRLTGNSSNDSLTLLTRYVAICLISIQVSGWYPFLRMTLLRCYETTANFGWLLYDLCSCRNSYIPLASSKVFNSTDSICSFGLAKRLGTETWISTAFVAKNSYGYIPGNFNFTRLSDNRLVGV